MANETGGTPDTRGGRVDQLRAALDVEQQQLAVMLRGVAEDLGFPDGGKWNPTRVSNVIKNKKPITLEEAAAIVSLAAKHGLRKFDWNWLVLGGEAKAQPRHANVRERKVG